ncbi:hypothetical protein B0H11DRAFT_974524 [Mycena galericulata]|nr:hypothetical protein B0H11DRAFT_974524 [Mycena galericulata]
MRKTEGYVSPSQKPPPELSQPNNRATVIRRLWSIMIGRGARRIWAKARLVQQHGGSTARVQMMAISDIFYLSHPCVQHPSSLLPPLILLFFFRTPRTYNGMCPPSLCTPRRCFSATVRLSPDNGEIASLILALDVKTSNLRPGMMAISLTASNVLYLVRLTVETLIGRSARSTVALSMPGLCIRACGTHRVRLPASRCIAPRLNIIDLP